MHHYLRVRGVIMEVRIYEREKLYKEIWAEPMTKVAERYNVSDVALKKTCKKLNIPVPGRGHWARVYAGEKITTQPLPEQKGNDKIVVRDYSESTARQSGTTKKTGKLNFLSEEQMERVLSFCSSIVVPNELENLHGLVKDTIQYFKSRKDSTKPPVNRVFCIKATEEQKNRAYRILDTLFKAFEHLGYTIVITAPKAQYYRNYEPRVWDNVVNIQLGKDSVKILIREMQHRVPHIPTEREIEDNKRYSFMRIPEHDIVHNGKLNFIIDEYIAKRKNWRDGEKHRIEDEIGDIIIAIIETIHDEKIRREQSEIEAIKRKEEERKKAILQKKYDKEREKVSQLVSSADDYHKAMKVYEYISAMERELVNIGDAQTRNQLTNYIFWAKQKADWLNPLLCREDELLGKRYEEMDIDEYFKDEENE